MINSGIFIGGANNWYFHQKQKNALRDRALNACQDNLRKVVDVSRKIPQLAECFASGDKEDASKLFSEIRTGEEEVIKARRMVSQELAEIGAILIAREDFLRFTNLSSEIADF